MGFNCFGITGSLLLFAFFLGKTSGRIIKRGAESGGNICNSQACQTIADRLSSSMNTSANPCEDFYQYACGGWMQSNPIPESWSYIDTWNKLRGEVSDQIQELMGLPVTGDDIEAAKKVKTIYSVCMDEDEIERRGIEPMQYVFNQVGSWPLLDADWSEEGFDLIDLLLKARKYDRKFLVYVDVGVDLMNGSYRIVRVDQPVLGMSRDHFLGAQSSTALPAFRQMAHDVAVALGGTDCEALNRDIDDMVEFATKVANITAPSSQRRYLSQVYNKMTLGDMKTTFGDKFDWRRYIQGVLAVPEVDIQIDDTEPVMVLGTPYLSRFTDLIETTPKRTLANYVMWLMLRGTVSHLTTDFRLLSFELSKVLYGVKTLSSRSSKCVSSTNIMGDVIGRMFVDAYFDDPAKNITKDMAVYLRKAFKSMLVELDWMDEETRTLAKEKADAMSEIIGYPDVIRDDAHLNGIFETLNIQTKKYFENTLNSGKFVSEKYLNLLRKLVDKRGWTTSPTTVNCFYNSLKNQITFPAGILQPPFFNKLYPKSMNYGGIGMLIGHEITHGFDDAGREFDKDGKYHQWWSDDVIANFKNESQCIIDQYGEYLVPEANMDLNGIRTQGENIADNGGLQQAYRAYHDWLSSGSEEDFTLPGFESSQQLFFLNFAQIFCQSLRPEEAKSRVLRGVHSPARFRVNGSLRNFKAFSEAYNCQPGSFMTPDDTCRLW